MPSPSPAIAQDIVPPSAVLVLDRTGDRTVLRAEGRWTLETAAALDRQLRMPSSVFDAAATPRELTLDTAGIERLDSAGAWLLVRTKRDWERRGFAVRWVHLPPASEALIETVERDTGSVWEEAAPSGGFIAFLERLGRILMGVLARMVKLVEFIGMVASESAAILFSPRRLRLAATVAQMEKTGLDAIPIVGLLSFLLGVVFAFQGADQLARFGAQIFTVNLLGIAVLREVGAIMTAIIVAGRSGSAFTAQIGSMQVNEEIDALRTLGVSPIEVLVLPRLIALFFTLPLLTFFANLMGILGGALMCYFDLGITFPVFLHQLRGAVSGWSFSLGLIKAPVFAFMIGTVGCFEGLQVERNAASVGSLTTRSVVESIFLVILADAAFSILFSLLKI